MWLFLCMMPLAVLIIRYCTIAHPYMLADNRHYTFYIWKDVLNKHPLVRYMFAPGYVLCGLSVAHHLGLFRRSAARSLWVFGLFVCTAAAIVPAGLIELRYFTVFLILDALNGVTRFSECRGFLLRLCRCLTSSC